MKIINWFKDMIYFIKHCKEFTLDDLEESLAWTDELERRSEDEI